MVEAKWNGFLCVKLVVSFSLSCCHRNLYRVRDKLSTDGGNKRGRWSGWENMKVFLFFFYTLIVITIIQLKAKCRMILILILFTRQLRGKRRKMLNMSMAIDKTSWRDVNDSVCKSGNHCAITTTTHSLYVLLNNMLF
jgi:uncharacterized membrane protein